MPKHKKSKTQVVYTEYEGINNIGESFSSELHGNNQNNITSIIEQQRTHSEDISDELRQKSMNSIELLSMNEQQHVNKDSVSDKNEEIAKEMNMDEQTVRNFFGGDNYTDGQTVGFHLEPGPDGGICRIDDSSVIERALCIIDESYWIGVS